MVYSSVVPIECKNCESGSGRGRDSAGGRVLGAELLCSRDSILWRWPQWPTRRQTESSQLKWPSGRSETGVRHV